ncbi:hypothetical protein EDD37DRAFT_694003 [Exophiala viscosa]|uniref:uncharacterized protein n=1 Tax=Exophiala viscosa TaxID=2486360 RepID=UPI00219837B8|nr:hypothetical protein EDD37DRAFT_694003 [Exophiala viscosa]
MKGAPENMNGATNGTRTTRRAVGIAGCSGGVFDRIEAIANLSKNPHVDVITGDWMSEMNMTFRGSSKIDREALGQENGGTTSYEATFIEALIPAIPDIAANRKKVVVNAGASDIEAMAKRVQQICKDKGTDLKVAWITGDDVTEKVTDLLAKGEEFLSLPADQPIQDWGWAPVCAQCYLGGVGVAEALATGADIVIGGRLSDASPALGAAIWWHQWSRQDFTQLAHALIAGHLIECSTYVTGGYYTGFKKELLAKNNCTNFGFPIAQIEESGEFTITKEENTGGIVSVDSVLSQLLYEIQGVYYHNSDVTAELRHIKMTQDGPEKVRVSGIVGHPPPPTTKVGITAKGGYQAEFHFFLTGLDIEEKRQMVERQTVASMGHYRKEFHTLTFTVTGSPAPNPKNQDEATVDLRIFAQTKNPDIISAGSNISVTPDTPCFARWCVENCLMGYPGSTPALDMRQAVGKPYFEYWVALLPQTEIQQQVHAFHGSTIDISPPEVTKTFPRQQPCSETENPLAPGSWGPTTKAPLGHIVHGRSGDKSSDANVGFFARDDEEWEWLRSSLTIPTVKSLLQDEYKGGRIERFEMPHVRAVHFLLKDHLDRGVNSTASYDSLGKNVCEYLRAKWVNIPTRYLDKGKI